MYNILADSIVKIKASLGHMHKIEVPEENLEVKLKYFKNILNFDDSINYIIIKNNVQWNIFRLKIDLLDKEMNTNIF